MNDQEIYQLVDLTCLKDDVQSKDILLLANDGKQKNVAALCVWPENLKDISLDNPITKATVVNFPSGNGSLFEVISLIDTILESFPQTEIDYVFPYQSYLNGETESAIAHCHAVVAHCHQRNSLVKVIMETGAFGNPNQIYHAAMAILSSKCDFLKTSTGKIAIGATPDAVGAICDAIFDHQSNCGVKVSGGIKTFAQAKDYLQIIQSKLNLPINKTKIRFGCSQMSDKSHESTY